MSTEGTTPAARSETAAATRQPPAPPDSIVVGHDGSTFADHALSTAFGLADQLHAPIVIVRAWSIDTAPRPASWEFGYVSSFAEYSDAVRAALIEDTAAMVHAFPHVSVDYRAVHAGPARSLIEVSRDARMLVVGSRGRGNLAGLLLGSVSDQCTRLSVCPVLVTRKPATG
ncbi:universal stress protein [Cryobacterium sp. TMT1-21]|uniref:Universal stress protein n=1 Tax=Cryobacterium shii TaxID=1259235 RepID=A0AAQ2C640_9MICO|nr:MULTISPECIES: universal stress protein [Cryobacterium]TFC46624.1 universal stress protein [Cryobacterium shii]TFD14086.1 universal stress protein [Cryobacterium sp. TMT4-10]TFD17642.1 universal stress protein [Cryobacterium sp. TMT1-21]TFD36224.1 universal stress protein [Cryobacterium sp. TMT2-10]